jgi:hypothetical protein
MPNPWDNDPIVSASPIYGAPPKPESPPSGFAPAGGPIKPLTYVPGGPADPTRPHQADAGYRLKPDGSEEPIRGGPADKTANGGQLSPDALNAETTNWILTGKMSPLGMGNGPLRVQIENQRPLIMHQNGISDNALPAIQQQFAADSKAYSQRTQQLSFMKQALDAANQHVQQISGYLNELPAQTNAVPLNAVSLGAQRMMSGETVTNLDATIPLLQAEVAKIMTTNPTGGSGQLTDDARHEFNILNGSRSPQAKMEAMQALMEMVNRKISGTQAETDRLNQRLNGGLATYAHLGATPPGNGPGTPPSMGGQPPPNMPNDSMAPASGQTKTVLDPGLTPVRREYMARLQAGQSATQLMSFLKDAGVPLNGPTALGFARSVAEQAKFHRDHPNIPVSQYDTSAIDHHLESMGIVNRAMNAVGQSDFGAGAAAAGNAVTAGYLPDIVGATGGNTQQARSSLQYSGQDHPGAALTGSIIGGTTAALATEGALGGTGMAAGVGRSVLADTAYGAAAGSGASPENRLSGALVGGLTGAAASVAGQGIAKGVAGAFRGVTNKSVNALADAGVPLTVGQAVGQSSRVGKMVKGAEDRLSGFSGVGDMIKARQGEGFRKFNSVAFDKALEPVGGSVKGAVGEEAVANARQAVSDAFSAALKGKSAVPDTQFVSAARGPLERLAAIKRNDLGPEIVQQIEESTKDLFDPQDGVRSRREHAIVPGGASPNSPELQGRSPLCPNDQAERPGH